MEKPVEHYWQIRLERLKEALEENRFTVFLAEDAAEARKIVLEDILPKSGAKSVSWGGSMTLAATGLMEAVKAIPGLEVLDTADRSLPPEESLELRRRSLLVDLFIMGTNAVTETGRLVNLDGMGNRVAALTFGPRSVVVLVGRNKIVPDLEDAMLRIKDFAAPANAMRLDRKTPCATSSYCEECKSPERICNTWVITEKSSPKGRVHVVLINESLGF
jgi:L-lactate utilization protein LutB